MSVQGSEPSLIFQFPIYVEPGVDRYLIYWQLGAWSFGIFIPQRSGTITLPEADKWAPQKF